MATQDKDMEQQQKNKSNQDPNRTQSSGMGGSTSQQSGVTAGITRKSRIAERKLEELRLKQ